MVKLVLCIVGLLALGITASGCATIVHGTTQRVDVRTDPSGATVKVSGQTLTSPGSVMLARNDLHTLIISKEGYKTARVNLLQEQSPWVYADMLLIIPFVVPGGPMVIIDAMDGAAYNLTPDEIRIALDKKISGTATLVQHKDNIVQRPDLSIADLFRPLNDDKKVRICFIIAVQDNRDG